MNRIQTLEPQPAIEPESPYNFELDIIELPNKSGWEARVTLNGGKLRCHHPDRRALVLKLNEICIERIRATVPSRDFEMVLKAYEDFIIREETQYWLNAKKNIKLSLN